MDIKLWDKDNKYIWGRLEGTDIKLWDEEKMARIIRDKGIGSVHDLYPEDIFMVNMMQKYALEWLYRLLSEPGRLWKRYLINNPQFIWYFILGPLVIKKIRNYLSWKQNFYHSYLQKILLSKIL